MAKFIVYEVWTRARVIEAKSEQEAYKVGEPDPMLGESAKTGYLNLCNWHVVPVPVEEKAS